MRLGIDFGTTNSAAVVYDGQQLIPIRMAQNSQILPSLIYINRQHQATLGIEAAHTYIQRETGRPIRWRNTPVGNIEIVVSGGGSPIIFTQEIIVTYDDAAYGRLLQSVKTALRHEYYHGTQIFDRFYTLDELIALLLAHLKQAAEAQLGQKCSKVVIGRPVKFSEELRLSNRAEEIIYKAARIAGFEDISFHMEPVGALYLYHISTRKRSTALVFDFGGGTLDLTIAEVGGDKEPHILATRGVLVGGDDLDRRIMQSLLHYFGHDPENERALPPDILDALNNWQTMPELSRPHFADIFENLRMRSRRQAQAIDALQTLVSKNLGFALFSEIERVKRELSTATSAQIHFVQDEIRIYEYLTRVKFERMIAPELKQVENGIQQVMSEANVHPQDIDVVLRTGGSSLVPAFINLLTNIFGAEKLREMDALTSVVGGLGIIAHENRGLRGSYRSKYVSDVKRAGKALKLERKEHKPYLVRIGAECYADRDTTLRKIPVELSGLLGLKMVYTDRDTDSAEFLTLHLPHPAKVYVAYASSAVELPYWLQTFNREDMTIEVTDDWWGIKELQVSSQNFEAGQIVLGGNVAPGHKGRIDTQYLVILEGGL
jgi:hypothetical chaperone protein